MAMAGGNPFEGMLARPGMASPEGGGIKSALEKMKAQYMEAVQAPAQDPTQMKAKNAYLAELSKTIKNLEGMLVRPASSQLGGP